jgi:hypothetical protein
MQGQPQEQESDEAYLRWVAEANGSVVQAAREHASTKEDLEPLRKRIENAVKRHREGLLHVPPRQQRQRKHTSTGICDIIPLIVI